MIVVKFSKTTGKPKSVNVIFDDGNKYIIHRDVAVKFGLRNGDEITERKLNELLFCNDFHMAKDVALKFFSYRQRTEHEIRKKLEKNNFSQKIIESVINNLNNIGLINDREFAEMFTRDRLKKKGIGKVVLRQHLIEKGIKKDIINQVIENNYQNINEKEFALETGKKQLKKYMTSKKQSDEKKNQSKIAGFLARRGFSWDIITYALHQLFNHKGNR